LSLAFIFPGQGSQSVGMGQALASVSPEAARTWQQADEALGEPISRLAWEGPAEQLDLTVNAQPALLATSVAAFRALQAAIERSGPAPAVPGPSHVAGHSMGQYSAMVAAGVLTLPDALRLVRERGRLMQAASDDGAMAAIIGLDGAREPELVAAGEARGVLTVANRNSPGQIVISGQRAAVEAAVEAARDLGARRAVLLPVSVAAHSPLMAEAAEGMRRALADVELRAPAHPLLANADGALLTTAETCRAELIEHLTRGVDWVVAVTRMRQAGVGTFLEVGPGRVLVGLVKRIAPDARAIAFDDLVTAAGLDLSSVTDTAASHDRAQE
jgi:[acyl-carrier-protein] S-malonyltransferase